MEEDLTKYGFRKGFSWKNRFNLKTKVEFHGKIYEVSTVDLGLNYNHGKGKPLYYETMIFLIDNTKNIFEKDKENEFSDFQLRYSTEEDARKCHKAIVKLLESGELK